MTSLQRWFSGQHPSRQDVYNDPAAAAALSDTVDRMEVTLNDDQGAQYIETHLLSVPPVPCLDAGELAFLARLAARSNVLTAEEYARGELVVESIVRKAQMLLKCAHDGLADRGLEHIGELFAAPLTLDESLEGEFTVCGTVRQEDTDTDINKMDVRARFAACEAGADVAGERWTYPAPAGEADEGVWQPAAPSSCTGSSSSSSSDDDSWEECRADSPASTSVEPVAAANAAAQGAGQAAEGADGAVQAAQNGAAVDLEEGERIPDVASHAAGAEAGDVHSSSAAAAAVDSSPATDEQHDTSVAAVMAPGVEPSAAAEQPSSLSEQASAVVADAASAHAGKEEGEGTAQREGEGGMKRVASWTNDKFTARPTRTHYPPLSEINHLLDDELLGVDDELPGDMPATVAGAEEVLVRKEGASAAHPRGEREGRSDQSGGQERCRRSRSPVANRHVICARTMAQRSAARNATAEATEAEAPAGAAPASEASGNAVAAAPAGDETWVQPYLGSLDATDALCVDHVDSFGNSSDGADGWQETLRSPTASGPGLGTFDGVVPSTPPKPSPPPATPPADMERTPRLQAESSVGRECLTGPPVQGILKRSDDGTRLAERQVAIKRTPPLLLMHLNRFQHTGAGAHKRQRPVSFPFQLFVHPAIAGPPPKEPAAAGTAVRYRLKAVLVHVGPRHDSGHNICYAWRPTSLVRTAARVLKWVPPGPTAPISIPGRPAPNSGRRRGGCAPGSLHLGASSASTSSPPRRGTSGRLGSSLLTSQDSAESETSARPSLDGAWSARSAARRGAAASGTLPATLDEGGESVDWEELADQPLPMRGVPLLPGTLASPRSDATSAATEPRGSFDGERPSCDGGTERTDEDGDASVAAAGTLLADEAADDAGVWLKCHDESVTAVPWETVASADAYMLMYEQL